jgi:hypothetical protein
MKAKKILIFGILALFLIFDLQTAEAATLFMLPKAAELQIGQTFDLEVRVNTENQGFNAAQAVIQFPKDILEVKSIDSSPGGTIFNFWLEEPQFSNADGKISFIGGVTNGVIGASIQILKIKFTVKGVGNDNIVISDAAITASDGSGTNILSTVEASQVLSKPASITLSVPVSTVQILPEPTQITKTPVVVQNLPAKPVISVPMYPEQSKWYNTITSFLAEWNLPNDISGISTFLNKESVYTPAAESEGLFTSKIFPMLSDGIWYLHIRFKNNVGWGQTVHYKISIDSFPPEPFSIEVLDGLVSDNPAPTLKFDTNDSFSGINNFSARIDDGAIIEAQSGKFVLPLQLPGKHNVLIMATDNADNIRESGVEIETLPIASPTITFINKNIFVNEGNLAVSGSSLPKIQILVTVKNKDGQTVSSTETSSDEKGSWEAIFRDQLKKDAYFVEITAKDERGALSLPVKSEVFKIREKPLLTIAGVEITQFWFLFGIIIIIAGSFVVAWLSYRAWRRQLERKVIIAQRDIVNAFTNAKNIVEKVLNDIDNGNISENKVSEIEFILKKALTDIEKTQKYITENIKEISE